MSTEVIYSQVQEHYGASARDIKQGHEERIAKHFGYSAEELLDTPEDANLGLSCGNPHALANLKEGETVVDLGSGAGFDVFLAAKKVGSSGKAIGVDMNQDMLKRANQIKDKNGSRNVTFVESRISAINLPNDTADCVISNCVINLVPESEKPLVFQEMYRTLKPGGRLAISDVLAKKELPDNVRNDMALYVGCISGASQVSQYEEYLRTAGFKDVLIVDDHSDLNAFSEYGGPKFCGTSCKTSEDEVSSSCCGNGDSTKSRPAGAGSTGTDFNEFAGSFKIYAVK